MEKTTPSTLVAFCSSRMMRPCRDELRDMTLEFREWWERTVPRCVSKHGAELLVEPSPPFIPFKMLLWFLSVADRLSGDVIVGILFGVSRRVVRWPPKLDPRLVFWLRRVSQVTTELDLVCVADEKLIFRIGIGVGDVAGVVAAECEPRCCLDMG